MTNETRHFYEFGPFRLDPVAPFLWRGDQPVSLTPKALETLVALVQQGGQVVSREELIEAVWPDTVVEENNLSVNVSALRKALGDSEDGEKYIETVPRRGYRFAASVREVPFESAELVYTRQTRSLTLIEESSETDAAPILPGGASLVRSDERAEPAMDSPPPIQAVSAKLGSSTTQSQRGVARLAQHRLSIGLGAAAIVVAVSLLAYFYSARNARIITVKGAINSVAVMPFVNSSADPNTEYLSDGITESLINQLSRLPNLKVMSRNSVFHYKGRESQVQAIARELGVQAVLSGRVVQRGDGISISVELVNASDNSHIWGEQYERKLGDLLSVQREITQEITDRLHLPLTGAERILVNKRYTENAEAYQLYLKGRYFWNKRTAEGLKKGIEYFNGAIERDAHYALAYSGLADSYTQLSEYDVMNAREAYPKASEAATRALAIDEGLAEAHASLGVIKAAYDWDWSDAEREYKRAIELKPNYAPAHQWYAEFLAGMGRHEEALAEIKRAQQLDPLSLITNAVVAWILYFARQYDEVIAQVQRVLEMDANFAEVYPFLGRAYEQKGRYTEAIAAFQKRQALVGFGASGNTAEGAAQEILTHKAYWQKRLRRLEEEEKTRFGLGSAHRWAECYAQLGEKDQAFYFLEKSFEERSYWLMYLKVAPNLDNLRSDPRFTDLLRRVKLLS
jgi:TolB-like protein/DNA-binding winged helix-turn-helix (wHTH) protein/Tfp pilus assembly protein PilF